MNATAKTTAHANCSHAATKADRAKCRRQKAAYAASNRAAVCDLVASYYGNTADAEEIIFALHEIDPSLTVGYFDNTLDVEEIIANARYYGA
jgi:hypothetical protein